MQVTSEDEAEQLVSTLSCSISMIVAPLGVTVDPLLTAVASVKVTVPKSANGTSEQELPVHSSKSSTIHSAFSSQSDPSVTSVNVSVTVVPVVRFSIVAEPLVVLVATTVRRIESPSAIVMPEKSSI